MNTSSKESSVRPVTSTRKRAFVAGFTGLSIAAAAGGVLILANPASAVPVANSVCHSMGNGAYVLIEPIDEGVVHGHSSHSNDIIPDSRNWTAPNIAIWNNNCVALIPSPTATPSITPTVTPSPSVTPTVTTTSGAELVYRVTARETIKKNKLPLDNLFAITGSPRLTLISCAGYYSADNGGYQDNIVITAVPAAKASAGRSTS